jgi:hypothetical protein
VTGSLWGCVGDETSALYLYTSTGKKAGQAAREIGPEDFLSVLRGTRDRARSRGSVSRSVVSPGARAASRRDEGVS